MSDKWYCAWRKREAGPDYAAVVPTPGRLVGVAAYEASVNENVRAEAWLTSDDAIALGKRLIELGEEAKRGD